MPTEAELRKRAKQAIDLGATDLYASDQAAHESMDKNLRAGAPSDEELAHQVRQGAIDAAAEEDANRGPYNKASLMNDARNAVKNNLKYVSPLGGYMYNKAISDENQADRDASAATGTTNVEGMTSGQAAASAQGQLAQQATNPQLGKMVIGYTKGGFQPSSRQGQTQVSREQMPDGYWDIVNGEMGQRKIAGESQLAQQDEMLRQQQHAGAVRKTMVDKFLENNEIAAQQEDKALQGAQARIDSAIQAFQGSGPQMITYRDLWDKADTGGKVLMALGFITGTLGGGRDGQNSFLQELDKTIQRKIDIQEKQAQRNGQAIGFAQNAYAVLHQRLQDRDATRKVLNALYLAQFDQQVENQANAIGLNYSDGRAADFRSKLLDQYRQLLKEGSAKVIESQAQADKYVPAQAITVGGGPEAQAAYEEAGKYEDDRRKKLLPEKRAGIQMLRDAANALGEKGLAGRMLLKHFLKDPKTFTSSVYLEGLSPESRQAVNKLSAGLDLLMRQEGGKTLTDSEIARTLSRYVGSGSKEDILRGSDTAQAEVDQLENSLHSQYPRGYPVGNLRRKIYENTEQPHELKGEEKATDITKDVISPEGYIPPPSKKKKGE